MSLDIDLGGGAFLIYGTPVFREVMPDAAPFCEALHRIVLAHEKSRPELRTGGRSRSNQGGWRSDPDLFKWPEPEIAVLRGRVEDSLNRVMQLAVAGQPGRRVETEFGLAGWANLNRHGDYNVLHSHAGSHWSGAFYVSMGEPDPEVQLNGAFELYDPRGAATMGPVPGFNFGHTLPVQPEAGLMLIFPSFLLHSVHPFRGKGERISIAFNAQIRRTETRAVSG